MIVNNVIREKTNKFISVCPVNIRELEDKASAQFAEDSSKYATRDDNDPSLSYNAAVPVSVARAACSQSVEDA